MLTDLRYAARQFIKYPGFTAVAVLILGLGIGANSTIFTLINSLFLQEPPAVQESERLVRFTRTVGSSIGSLPHPDYAFYRDNNQVFEDAAAFVSGGVLGTANTGSELAPVQIEMVSGNYFNVLGTPPSIGRMLSPNDDRAPGAHPLVVLSHGFWQRYYGADPQALGSTIHLNGTAFTVIGVAAEAFRGISPAGTPPDLWVPLTMQPVLLPGGTAWFTRVQGEVNTWLQGIARLQTGVGVAAARDNMTALARQMEVDFPEWNEGVGVFVTEHYQYFPTRRGQLANLTGLLLAAVATVLLIACANIAILLLARGSARQRELGVRLAIGAGRTRIIRQLLTESLLLAGAGGVVGLVIATWSADAAAALIPVAFNITFWPDLTVVGFTAAVAVVAAVIAGLVPAWLASRPEIVHVLKTDVLQGKSSVLRKGLVVVQVALAIVLVSGAGLFLRSLQSAQRVELGFETEGRVFTRVNLRNHGYSPAEGKEFIGRALERMAMLPGVTSASTMANVPLGRGMWSGGYTAPGVEPPPGQQVFQSGFNAVGPGFFRTMGIPILQGREFALRDDDGAPLVAIVNETVATTLWPGRDPVGQVIARGERQFTVIGLARDAVYYALGEQSQQQIYFPQFQTYYFPRVNFVVRAAGAPATIMSTVGQELRALDPDLAFTGVRTMDDVLATTTGRYRVAAMLLSVFALLALILASVGLYGVLTYLVVQRTREFGIRMALGAHGPQVARTVLVGGLRLALIGIALGAAAAWLVSTTVSSQLFAVSPRDPTTFVLVPLVLVAVALLASYLPARRASRLDPVEALRYQ